MSNKPKHIKRLIKYNKTKGELKHEGIVKEAQAFAFKCKGFNNHKGNKRINTLLLMKENY